MPVKTREVIRTMRELEAGFDRSKVELSEATLFLEPDGPVTGRILEMPCDEDDRPELVSDAELFVPPAATTATRLPPNRTKGHSRGYLPNPRSNRLVSYASLLELRALTMLIANKQVLDVRDQPEAVTYVAQDGSGHRHIFDYLATHSNGWKTALAVKPRRRVFRSGLADTIVRIRRQSLAGFANEALILTENVLTPAIGWNAASMVHALRSRNVDDLEKMRRVAARFSGVVNVRTLIDLFRNEPAAWIAVWNLIFERELRHVDPSRKLVDCPYVIWKGKR